MFPLFANADVSPLAPPSAINTAKMTIARIAMAPITIPKIARGPILVTVVC